ncbi:uncharacterized protein Z519_10998 [Cladophialophora bantiana CBS 173.52]|uniref:AMP-dependent synthetase/ligase domain-containing protein n=1 Tax=Cladophialophora bantiana (strain ATCC 10958 / CBS 173.52 / CDC B-1940 / NIH 8579) TaxID=1442370 RepID=A0A0D2HV87_CLAB1|nr:uncharacterized protein Z519_10998 [Cladophialophora bantiana CBS 173.52]KIW88429.1 hypothetical protein Z519_10998 [Cladophialophora bantiana CBS 173.52]
MEGNLDRTSFLPSHTGPHVFPNSPFFSKLLRHARRGRVALRDVDLGLEKTYTEILSDALSFRAVIERSLSDQQLKAVHRGDEVYIGVLAAGGYEFTVAVLAVLGIGAAVVPIATSAPVTEASYFVTKSRQALLLVSEEVIQHGRDIRQNIRLDTGIDIPMLTILPSLPKSSTFSVFDMVLSSNRHLDDNAPGVVIFTSGTTGRPKGAVMRRSYTHETALAIGEGYDVCHTDVLLHVLPVHHTTGLQTSFFVFLVAGACIEFKRGSFDPDWVWKRWLAGGLTVFSAVPTILLRLKWHYEKHIAHLPPAERQRYDDAGNAFRDIMCGSSALQDPVQEFWTTLRRNRPILTRYGATEFPGCLKVPANARDLPKGCVGLPVPGVELKLSEGDEGELLVRSPYMFSKYLFDTEATRQAHDADGFFKTGDILRREGQYYFVVGRASVDIIKSGGYKISAIDVERACLKLPYVSEVAVLGVEDEEFGQRVAAVVAVKSTSDSGKDSNNSDHNGDTGNNEHQTLTIDRLRADLRADLTPYKLPTLLRVVHGELPKGGTGKVQKKILGPQMFQPGWRTDAEVQFWDPKRNTYRGGAKL